MKTIKEASKEVDGYLSLFTKQVAQRQKKKDNFKKNAKWILKAQAKKKK